MKSNIENATVAPIFAESPNDSQETKDHRKSLQYISDLIHDLEIGCDAGWYEEEGAYWEATAQIQQYILREWLKATARDFTNNERHKLIQLTNDMLNGV